MAGGQDDLVHRVAKAIAAKRREKGLSQEGLAALLGIAVKNLQRMESGNQNLSLATLDRICAALDVTAAALLAEAATPARPVRPPPLERLARAGYPVRAATERGRRSKDAVPVTTLRAAAGRLTGVARGVEILGWVTLPTSAEPSERRFVAEIHGSSMAPRIRSGALCLFGPAGGRPFGDRIVLVSHEAVADDALGGPYALKRVRAMRRLRDGRTRVVLESINPRYAPVVVDTFEDELRVIAELVRVLIPGSE